AGCPGRRGGSGGRDRVRVVASQQGHADGGPPDPLAGRGDGRAGQVLAGRGEPGGGGDGELEGDRGGARDQLGHLVVAHAPAEVVGALHVDVQGDGDGLAAGGALGHGQVAGGVGGGRGA